MKKCVVCLLFFVGVLVLDLFVGCASTPPVTEERVYSVEQDKLFSTLQRLFLEMENTQILSTEKDAGYIVAQRLGFTPWNYECLLTAKNQKETAITISIWNVGMGFQKTGSPQENYIDFWERLEQILP